MRFKFKPLHIGASYKGKLLYIIVGTAIGALSMLYSGYIIKQLALKEINEIKLWSHAMTMASNRIPADNSSASQSNEFNRLLVDIINNNTIPSIITDHNLKVVKYTNIDPSQIDNPRALQRLLEKLASTNDPIEVEVFNNGRYYIFYGESSLLSMLRVFPYLQFCVVACFIVMVFISFRSSKQDEQKRVWIGMAKETAHQLGTPTSSLLGWLEYLKSQNTEQFVIDEMGKDITRLLKVVDRFSKIGSETILAPKNITEIVGAATSYFRTRIPKNVTLKYEQLDSSPLQAMVNDALFEWVIENLLKNALDALQGKGSIEVKTYQDLKWVYIDVTDSGKGMPKSSFTSIFNPGYTTKTRGWGLGLSLSKRIISEYHRGRIFVAESEIDHGTKMRVMLKRL
ncbi:MAG: HAMP domain-containing sensor histidine kinase [Rikenellaceae bacterium]